MHGKLALIALVLSVSLAPAAEPSVILRASSLDGLIGDLRHLFKQAGREDEGKEFEKAMLARTGPKGLEGVDTKKPLGLSAQLTAKVDQSPIFVMLPIADEVAFVKFVTSVGNEPKKQADGSYRVTIEGIPFINQVMFRFAHGYVYAMLKLTEGTKLPAEADLPRPELALGKADASVSLLVNLAAIPTPLRKLAISMIGLQMSDWKSDASTGRGEEADPLRDALVEDATAWMKALLEEGERLAFHIHVAPKTEQLRLELTASAREGTELANQLAQLGKLRSPAVSVLAREAALTGAMRLVFPPFTNKTLLALIDKNVNDLLDLLQAHERETAEPLAKGALPTLKAGGLDLAAQMRGPDKNGRYSVIVAVGVQEGKKLELGLKQTYRKLTARSQRGFKLEADKLGEIAIHQAEQERLDATTRELIGAGPVYFALRDDVLILAGGADALKMLKDALATKPAPAVPLCLEMHLRALAPALAKVDPEMTSAPRAAKQAFGSGDDGVRLEARTQSSNALSLKLTLPTATLTFANALDKARGK
ncbi:MAG: hypothetical protein SNJ82_07095 [Gemmataceae bacterium]